MLVQNKIKSSYINSRKYWLNYIAATLNIAAHEKKMLTKSFMSWKRSRKYEIMNLARKNQNSEEKMRVMQSKSWKDGKGFH